MSELDAKRRKNFLNNIGDTQVIITCTDEIKDEFESKSVFYVNNGVIKKRTWLIWKKRLEWYKNNKNERM